MLQAGIAKIVFKPKLGATLIGYFARQGGATGVHDEIGVRTLVLDDGSTRVVLCNVETCIIVTSQADYVRKTLAARGIAPYEHILIFCTHTHSAPAFNMPQPQQDRSEGGDWEESPLDAIIASVEQAAAALQPARLGAGFGMIYAHSINRRWLNRPIDPSLGVIRVDALNGTPLALVGNYACHNVVLGADNLLISGDWTGYCARELEAEFGGVVLMSQGGAGDINPLTETVRQRLQTGDPVVAIGEVSALYGAADSAAPNTWNIGDRWGGTFADAEALGKAVAAEMRRVGRAIDWQTDARISAASWIVDVGTPDAGKNLPENYGALLPEIRDGHVELPISLVRIGQLVIATHPLETFSEDSVTFRRSLQQMGIAYPMLITYANGWYGYLPPAHAFAEGGYEVGWAQTFGLNPRGQAMILQAMLARLHTWG